MSDDQRSVDGSLSVHALSNDYLPQDDAEDAGRKSTDPGPRVTHHFDYDPVGLAAVEEFHRYDNRGWLLIELSQTDVHVVLDHKGRMVSTDVYWSV